MNPWGSRCWLLTSPRTGSTYLQYLLNHNVGAPLNLSCDRHMARFSFGEHMSERFCKSLDDFFAWDPIVSKVHCHHFGAYLVDRPLLKPNLKDVRFVLLERRDLHAQAVSLAMADRTGVTQCNSAESQAKYHARQLPLDDAKLLSCFKAVSDYKDFWRNWLHSEPHLVVTYESLIEEPRSTVAQILDFLQTSHMQISLDVPLRKLNHPQTDEQIRRLGSLIEKRVSSCAR